MELLFSYKPRTLLDILNPKKKKVFDENKNPSKSKSMFQINRSHSNKQSKIKSKYTVNENVLYRNHFKEYVKWIPAKVAEIISPVTYLIKVNDHIRYVQENQIKKSQLDSSYHPTSIFVSTNLPTNLNKKNVVVKDVFDNRQPAEVKKQSNPTVSCPPEKVKKQSNPKVPCTTCVPKTRSQSVSLDIRPKRIRRKPDRLGMLD